MSMSVPVDGVYGALLDVVEDDGADEQRHEAEHHRRDVQHAEGVTGIWRKKTQFKAFIIQSLNFCSCLLKTSFCEKEGFYNDRSNFAYFQR